MKIKVLNSCAGPKFSAQEGQIFERDKSNAEWLDSKIRHGTAIVVGDDGKPEEPKKKLEESGGEVENPDILHDPRRARTRGRKRFDSPEGD